MWYLMWILVIVAAYGVWRYFLSIKTLGADQAGKRLRFGDPEDEVYPPGRVFVPWIPIKFDGRYPYELAKLPTRMFQLTYRAQPENRLTSQDDKPITDWEVTVFLVLPYLPGENEAIKRMLKTGVKMDEEGLKALLEDLIVPALRRVFAGMKYSDISHCPDWTQASQKATASLRDDEKDVLKKTGIAGNNPDDVTEGTGYLAMTIEYAYNMTILVAEEGAKAAEATKRQKAMLIVGPLHEAMDSWVMSQVPADGSKTFAQVKTELVVSGKYATHEVTAKDLILAAGNNLTVNKVEVGGPGGQQLPAGLQYLAIGSGGGGAGFMMGDRRSGKLDARKKRKPAGEMTREEREAELDEEE